MNSFGVLVVKRLHFAFTRTLFIVSSVVSFFLTIFSNEFLPEQFLRDSSYFEMRINSAVSGYTDSFQTMANLYSAIGIVEATLGLKILEWLIFYLALLLSRHVAKIGKNSSQLAFFSTFYLMLLPFYGSLFTKELLIVIFLTIYLVIRKYLKPKYRLFLILVFEIAVSIYLRQYYVITIAFTILYFIVGRYRNRFSILYPLVIISLFSTINYRTGFVTNLAGVDVFQIRNLTNEGLKIVARSRIDQHPPSGNLIHNMFSTLHVMQQIVFPYELLRADIYAFFTFFTVISVNLILLTYYIIKIGKTPTPEASFLFAFFSTALIFEPDLGSYVRHGFVFTLISITQLNNRKKNHFLE